MIVIKEDGRTLLYQEIEPTRESLEASQARGDEFMENNTDEQTLVKNLKKMIDAKTPAMILYQGLMREICPYLLGVTTKGKTVLHGFQYGGDSSRGPVKPDTGGWRYFYLDEIEHVYADYSGQNWYPQDFQKAEAEYQAPAFIVKVLAVTP